MDDGIIFLLGLLLGGIIGFFTNVLVMYLQFKSSVTGGQRVKWVRDATEVITASSNRGPLRDRYRYSLGVAIDVLDKAFSPDFNEDGAWPLLIEVTEVTDEDGKKATPRKVTPEKDRWSWFAERVRPVIADINNYSFLAAKAFRFFDDLSSGPPLLSQLERLSQLCIKIEEVVMLTDAAFENQPVVECRQVENKWRLFPKITEVADTDNRLQNLKDGYKKLHQAWRNWLNVAIP